VSSRPLAQESSIVARALTRAAGTRLVPGNAVRLLFDGPEAFPAMLDTIAQAERWLHFENYIIRSDATGWRFAEALAGRARAGVTVRLLYDWFGSKTTSGKLFRYLRAAGADVRAFAPLKPFNLLANVFRDHRKLVVADGRRAIVGGLCIGDEWTGDPTKGAQPWRDTAIEVVGPAAASFDRAFEGTWTRAGGTIPPEAQVGEVPASGNAEVGVIVGEPRRARVLRVTGLLAAGAADRLWITDAYLVAPRALFQGLLDAAREGVDVRLLLPGSSDVPLIRNFTRIGYRELLKAGVRIYEWEGAMLHAKTIVADGRWCRIGSSNLNGSSLFGNYELDALVDHPALAAELEAQFRRDIARSAEVERRPVRGPRRLQRVLPAALDREPPEVPPGPHHRRFRERRGRTVLALRVLASGARRSIFAPVAIILGVLGLLFVFLPRIMAMVVAAICVWLAIGAGIEAFRQRTEP
jgi:cardiolipin synthase A/B